MTTSLDLARLLLAHLPTDGTWGSLPVPDDSGRLDVITLEARRLGLPAFAGYPDHRERLTGGVSITASLPYPSYGGLPREYHHLSRETVVHRRLRPGWTEAQFLRAAEGVYARALVAARLQRLRENVADAFKPYEDDAVVQAEFPRTHKGHYRIYSMMTAEDCAFWLGWLTRWQARRKDADAVTTR